MWRFLCNLISYTIVATRVSTYVTFLLMFIERHKKEMDMVNKELENQDSWAPRTPRKPSSKWQRTADVVGGNLFLLFFFDINKDRILVDC